MKSVNSEAVVENPSSLLAALTNGTALSAAPLGMFSVPSVVPLNRPSNGNGMTALAATGSNSEYALAIGRAHVRTPVTNAQLVCGLLLEKTENKENERTKLRTP